MNILGISAFYHDSAACLLKNGEIIAAAQEERFTRKKHDPSFPITQFSIACKRLGLRLMKSTMSYFTKSRLLNLRDWLKHIFSICPERLCELCYSNASMG